MKDFKFILDDIDVGKKIYIGLSGGSDSIALLNIVASYKREYNLDVTSIHVNHSISQNSNMWQEFCKQSSQDLGINCIVKKISIAKKGQGFEAAARGERYKVFKDILSENDQLLLAHHADDVAETLLLRIFRGTGIDGLQGPRRKRSLGKGNIIRPLLEISKRDLMAYLNDKNIEFINDESNNNSEYDRNYIRNEIIPLIESRWQNHSNRLSRLSKLAADRKLVFNRLLNESYKDLIGSEIEIKKLKELPKELCMEIVRSSIELNKLATPNLSIMNEIYKTFILSNPSNKACVSWSRIDNEQAGGMITKRNKKIIISKM